MSSSTIGRTWPSELTVSRDPVSGATVRQLTNYRAHSNHSYFTLARSSSWMCPNGTPYLTAAR